MHGNKIQDARYLQEHRVHGVRCEYCNSELLAERLAHIRRLISSFGESGMQAHLKACFAPHLSHNTAQHDRAIAVMLQLVNDAQEKVRTHGRH